MTTIALPPTTGSLQALSRDGLHRLAPSVFAESAQPGVSPRYSFVSTIQVVDLLQDEGWEPVNARQQRARRPDRQGFQMHEVRFARRADLENGRFEVGQVRPELVLQNAHDGTRAYRIDAGLYRLVCSNGLVVADTDFAHVAIRHVDLAPEKFAAAARAVAESTPRVLDVIARWQSVPLTPLARHNFAHRAARLRWDDGQPVGRALDPERLLAPLHYGDDRGDLWTTYNVVQEHLLRGGDGYSANLPSRTARTNTTRAVTSLILSSRLNKALWSLAEEFAQN